MRSNSVAGHVASTSAVIFDLFGTLVPAYNHHAVLSEMARILGCPDDEFIRMFAGDTKEERETGRFGSLEENLRQICRALHLPTPADRITSAANARREFTRAALRPRADAVATLQALSGRSLGVGLISDCCEIVPPLWNETPLAPLVNVAVFSCRVQLRKPDNRIYQVACRELKVDPSRCLYIGDGGSDELSGATKAGMRAALLLVEAERSTDPYRLEIDQWSGTVIESLSEVLKLVGV